MKLLKILVYYNFILEKHQLNIFCTNQLPKATQSNTTIQIMQLATLTYIFRLRLNFPSYYFQTTLCEYKKIYILIIFSAKKKTKQKHSKIPGFFISRVVTRNPSEICLQQLEFVLSIFSYYKHALYPVATNRSRSFIRIDLFVRIGVEDSINDNISPQ